MVTEQQRAASVVVSKAPADVEPGVYFEPVSGELTFALGGCRDAYTLRVTREEALTLASALMDFWLDVPVNIEGLH